VTDDDCSRNVPLLNERLRFSTWDTGRRIYKSSCTSLDRLARAGPDLGDAAQLTERGDAYRAKGEPKLALTDFDQATAIDVTLARAAAISFETPLR
jgi:hypothetical protein